MGPSGSGKSTLMHILAGLDRPTSGTVTIDGEEITGLDDAELTRLRRDKLGFVFQFFNLIPVLTAEENMLLPLSIAGRKPDAEWFERLIDDGRPRRPPAPTARPSCPAASSSAWPWRARSLSQPGGGVRRRAHRQPRLEARARRCCGLLRQAVDEFGQTVVMVTHDPEAASYADRLVVLRDGLSCTTATPAAPRRDRADEGRGVTKVALRGLARAQAARLHHLAGDLPGRRARRRHLRPHRHDQQVLRRDLRASR